MAHLWAPDNKTKIYFPDDVADGDHFATRVKNNNFLGILKTLPDPDPILKKMYGRGVNVLRDLLADSHLESVWSVRCAAVSGASWEIVPGGEGERENTAFELATGIINNLDLHRVIEEMQEAVAFGMSPVEILWNYDGQYWTIENLVGKPAEWFAFDKDNQLVLKKGLADYEPVPAHRFLLVRHKASFANPYGIRQFSKCFWPVTFRKNGWKWWTIFIEKYGGAFLYGRYPQNASQKFQRDLLDALEKMVVDAVAIAPEGSQIDIKESTGKAASSRVHMDYMGTADKELSKTILGQTLTTDIGDKGSYAAAQTHNLVRNDLALADMRRISAALNRLLRKLTVFNFGLDIKAPKFQFKLEKDIKTEQAERDQKLFAIGWRPKKEYFIREYGMPEDSFTVLDPLRKFKKVFRKFLRQFNRKPEKKLKSSIIQYLSAIFKKDKKDQDLKKIETELKDIYSFAAAQEAPGQQIIDQIINDYNRQIAGAGDYPDAIKQLAKSQPGKNINQLTGRIDNIRYTAGQIGGNGER